MDGRHSRFCDCLQTERGGLGPFRHLGSLLQHFAAGLFAYTALFGALDHDRVARVLATFGSTFVTGISTGRADLAAEDTLPCDDSRGRRTDIGTIQARP